MGSHRECAAWLGRLERVRSRLYNDQRRFRKQYPRLQSKCEWSTCLSRAGFDSRQRFCRNPRSTQSQGSLVLSQDGSFLFAANPGSGTITTFRVVPSGLAFVGETNSGGAEPISIAIHGDLLYVLNTASITGFRILGDGRLSEIPSSTRFLATVGGRDLGASDIGFSPNGSFLVVTERNANQIVVFPVQADSTTGAPVLNPSHGNTPFALAFTPGEVLLVAEAAGLPGGTRDL